MERDEAKKELMELIGIKKEEETPKEELEPEDIKLKLGIAYEQIKEILSDYLDIKEEYKTIMALWILGCYAHSSFETYPYLFINAMRGSGKTRLLKLITILSNGQLLTSLTEAVMFRTKGTLGIDEFESISSKEKQALRELLNSAYKKGMKIMRMKKQKIRDIDGKMSEEQVIEEFEPYRPIIMANIYGIEEVLGDRCIHLILEKSNKPQFIKKVENFSSNPIIQEIKRTFNAVKCSFCSQMAKKTSTEAWNNYINLLYNYTNTLNYNTTYNYTKLHLDIEEEEFFSKIDKTKIDGRHLELFLPLFFIARFIDEKILDETLKIAQEIVEEKRTDEILESKDVMLYDFISKIEDKGEWITITNLTTQFREFVGEEDIEFKWITTRWIGKALKRLSLVLKKRRLGKGMDVIINVVKAKEKIKMFKHEEEIPKEEQQVEELGDNILGEDKK